MTRLIILALLVVWALVDAVLTAREMPTFMLKLWGFSSSLTLSLVFIAVIAFVWDWVESRIRRVRATK
jgi:hypothetical protein